MDRDVRVNRDAQDNQAVLPRLSDKSDSAATTSRVNRAMDVFANAQKLPAYTIQAPASQDNHHQQPLSPSHPPHSTSSHLPNDLSHPNINKHYFRQQTYNHTNNGSDSQDTISSAGTSASTDTDQLFTPSLSEGELSAGGGGSVNGSTNAYNPEHDFSSQESQLLQLSRLAASRERMSDANGFDAFDGGAYSRKRAADGSVKHTRNASSTSPIYVGGHSRNTSTVSVASTAGSRIGELSSELKTRLSYAMVKVNNGWQSHSIEQVENFASHAASPASSTSTIQGRHGSSVSPRIPGDRPYHRRHQSHASQMSISSVGTTIAPTSRALSALDTSTWSSSQSGSRSAHSTPPLPSSSFSSGTGSIAPHKSLAPPASIQPSRPSALSRRNSNPAFAPPSLASHLSHNASPHTPASTDPNQRTPAADQMVFSPHQNVREQDAIETLLFMSSPGNSSNMKQFPSISASQPLPAGYHHPHRHYQESASVSASPQRHALPSAPRKSLPTGRPTSQTNGSQPQPGRRGHNRTISEMDIDEPYGSPYAKSNKGTPKRRTNGAYNSTDMPTPRMKMPLSMPSGLSMSSKQRPVIGEDDIEKMLDRAAAASADDSSDSESEILIPTRRANHMDI